MDILAISCDSFNEDTNSSIGRCQGNNNHLNSLVWVRNWCNQYKVAFKINSVVNTYNWKEDMAEEIQELNPIRWKVRCDKGGVAEPIIYSYTIKAGCIVGAYTLRQGNRRLTPTKPLQLFGAKNSII